MVKDFNPLENEQVTSKLNYKRCLFINFQNNALFRLYGVLFRKREITLLNNKNATEGNSRLVWGVCALF